MMNNSLVTAFKEQLQNNEEFRETVATYLASLFLNDLYGLRSAPVSYPCNPTGNHYCIAAEDWCAATSQHKR